MRTALVTGGGAGIGRAIAIRLARDGMAVGVLGRRAENVREVAELITAEGGKTLPLVADVADKAQVAAALAQEAAAAVAYFACDDAAYVTGQILGVNGGCCS